MRVFYKLRANAERGGKFTMSKGTEEIAVFPQHMNLLLVCVNKTYQSIGAYHAARYSWQIKPEKAQQAAYVMAVFRGTIVGVFEADKWLPAKEANFPDLPAGHGNWHKQGKRFGFVGHSAPKSVGQLYLDKDIPKDLKFRGNPVRYVNF